MPSLLYPVYPEEHLGFTGTNRHTNCTLMLIEKFDKPEYHTPCSGEPYDPNFHSIEAFRAAKKALPATLNEFLSYAKQNWHGDNYEIHICRLVAEGWLTSELYSDCIGAITRIVEHGEDIQKL